MPNTGFNFFEHVNRAIADLKKDIREDLSNFRTDIREDMDELKRGRERIIQRLDALEKSNHESNAAKRIFAHVTHVIAILFGGMIGTLVGWLRH